MIRGVCRFDDDFSDIEDEKAFRQFVEGKLKFLPGNVVADICQAAELSDDLQSAQRQRTLPEGFLEAAQTIAPRTKAFFRRHRYFENALIGDRLATDVELRDAQNYLEIQFVKRILAPLLNEEGPRMARISRIEHDRPKPKPSFFCFSSSGPSGPSVVGLTPRPQANPCRKSLESRGWSEGSSRRGRRLRRAGRPRHPENGMCRLFPAIRLISTCPPEFRG